jgi:hypothetical protein
VASIKDLWIDEHGRPTARHGKGRRWLVRYWFDGERRSETFAKKGEATRFANWVEAGKDAGTLIDPHRMVIGYCPPQAVLNSSICRSAASTVGAV